VNMSYRAKNTKGAGSTRHKHTQLDASALDTNRRTKYGLPLGTSDASLSQHLKTSQTLVF
jgi:hypothetical protein